MLFSPGWRAPVRQGAVLAVFALGLVLGGTLSGAAIWLLSGLAAPLPADARTGAILALAVLGALRELGVPGARSVPLPQNARQIPQDVLQRRLRLGAWRFGFELGTGVRTYVSASAPYVLAGALLLSHQTAGPTLLAGAAFGAGRAASAALTLWSRDPGRAALIDARMRWAAGGAAVAIPAALALLLLG